MAKKRKLTKEEKQQELEREVYMSCLYIDESERRPYRDEMSFEELYVECVLDI